MDNILNSVSIEKAKEILSKFAELSIKKDSTPMNVMLIGSPGLGKSTIVKAIAKENNMGLIDLRLAGFDATDVGGLPYVSNGTMVFSEPEWFKEIISSNGKPYILFLDELTNAPASTQSAAYRLLLDREITNGKKLPNNVFIVAAGNTKEDQSGARPLLPPLANRFALHLFIDKNKASESFLKYTIENKFDRSIIGFLSYKKSNVSVAYSNNPAFATPRSWEYVNTILTNGMFDGTDLDMVIAGSIGTDVASEFSAFRELNHKLPDWEKLKHDSTYVYDVPNDDEALKYSISVGLSIEMLDSLEQDDAVAIKSLAKFLEAFSDEIKILVFRTMKKDQTNMRKLVKYAELLKEFRSISKYVLGE
jgi:hypothetical protein